MWDNVFGAQWSQCQHRIDTNFGNFISRLRWISPEYYFATIVLSSLYRLIA